MPKDLPFIPHGNILRYEEILRICKAAAKTGVRIVKVTGGEPLVRKGCAGFIRELKSVPGIGHVTLTTNGVFLGQNINILKEANLDCVNISLDTLDAGVYERITGQDCLGTVRQSILKAVESGLRVKINCVPVRGLNETEIVPIASLAGIMPIDIRFIELMPTMMNRNMERVTGREVYERILTAYPDLTPDSTKHGFGPARYYKSAKLMGGIGFINAIGDCFCPECNRIRLTSEGFLKQCLYFGGGLDLRAMLRGGASDSELETALAGVIYNKPGRHQFGGKREGIPGMSGIGG